MKGYKMEVAKEVRRQSNEYGRLMLANMKTDRDTAMLCHAMCRHLYEHVAKTFGLTERHFCK